MIVPSVTELTYVWAMPAAGPASPTLHVIVVVVPLLTRFDILKLFPYDGSVFAGPGWFPVTPLYVHEKLSASSLNAILSPMETAIVGFGNETVNSPDVELYVELFGVTVTTLPSVQLRIAAIAYNFALPTAYKVGARCASWTPVNCVPVKYDSAAVKIPSLPPNTKSLIRPSNIFLTSLRHFLSCTSLKFKNGKYASVSRNAWSAISVLFLDIKYAASRYVPLALLAITSFHKNDRVSIADVTSLQAFPLPLELPSAFNKAVDVITLSSKYLGRLEYFGV